MLGWAWLRHRSDARWGWDERRGSEERPSLSVSVGGRDAQKHAECCLWETGEEGTQEQRKMGVDMRRGRGALAWTHR